MYLKPFSVLCHNSTFKINNALLLLSGDPPKQLSAIIAPVLVIGSLIVGLLLVLLICRKRSQREYIFDFWIEVWYKDKWHLKKLGWNFYSPVFGAVYGMGASYMGLLIWGSSPHLGSFPACLPPFCLCLPFPLNLNTGKGKRKLQW